jgi:hypothetical protein
MATLPKPLKSREGPGTLHQDEVQSLWHSLTPKQQSWLQEYLSNGLNASEAVRQSEYKAKDNDSCRAIGHQNRQHPKLRPLIEHACRRHMSQNEVLKRVSQIARASWEDFLRFEDGQAVPDLAKARQRGKMHLVDKIEWGAEYNEATGEVDRYVKRIELKDDQKAQQQLLKATGAFDTEDGGTKVENLTINQWNNELNAHLQGDAQEERWPSVPVEEA